MTLANGPTRSATTWARSILGPRNLPLERENPDLLAAPATDSGTIPNLKFSFDAAHNRLLTGGWAREVTVRELPVATELAGVNMRLKPGGVRELHWHKEAEWAYMLAGRARITADRRSRAATSSTTSARATSGTSRPGSRTRSRGWRRAASSCSSSTTATSPRTRRS